MSESLFNYTFNINTENSSQASAVYGARDVPPVPVSYFFAESSLCNQVEAGTFGPDVTDAANKFRITSIFDCGVATKIYAPVAGRIFIQPSSESNAKVNVLIKPLAPLAGIKVKYFIFRGLQNDDFFESTVKVRKIANAVNPSAFLTRIWSTYNYWNPGAEDDFHAKFLGYDLSNQALEDEIEEQFFKSSENLADRPFEYFTALEGEWIGSFAGKIGIDIVLDEGDYVDNASEFKFDLELLRKGEIVLDMNDYADNYKKKRIRETVFNFIDPAAFYGFHVQSGTVKLYTSGTAAAQNGNAIYTTIVSKFFSRNRIYVYLKSNRNRSYNYYKNYTSGNQELKIGPEKNALQMASYLTSSWPVLIYDIPQVNDQDSNKLFMALICDDDGNQADKAFYNIIGNLQGDKDGQWAYANKVPISEAGQTFTKEIQYDFPNTETGGQKYFIANIVHALYIGKTLDILNEAPSNDDNIKDNFALVNSEVLFSNDMPVIEEQFSNNPIFKPEENDFKQILYNKYVIDEGTAGFKWSIETLCVDYNAFSFSDSSLELEYLVNKSAETESKKSSFSLKSVNGNFYELHTPFFFNREKLSVDGDDLMTLSLTALDQRIFKKFVLGLTSDLKNEVFAYITANNLTNAFAYLKLDTVLNVSPEKKCYKYLLKIIAEDASNQFAYFDFIPATATDGVFYSMDNQMFFTKKYTQDIPESIVDSLIEFQSFPEDQNESTLFTLTSRLVSTGSNPASHPLYDLKGFAVSYEQGEKDSFGESKVGPVQIPVGTRVVHLGDSKNPVNGVIMAYVTFYHNGKFRDGFIDKNALGLATVRIKTSDVVSNNSLHTDAFIDDAGLILNYNNYIAKNAYARTTSPELCTLIDETFAQYNQLLATNTRQQLNTKLTQLFNDLNNDASPISMLPIPNNRAATALKYMQFEPLKRLADKDMLHYHGKYLLNPITNGWIDYWHDTDATFASFLNTNIVITVEGSPVTYKYADLINDSYQEGNGAVTLDSAPEPYLKLANFLKQVRSHLIGRPAAAVSATPEAQWLTDLPESELFVYSKYVTIDEKDSVSDGLPFNIWYNQTMKRAGYVALDDSIGYLNSASCLSLFIHEMNTTSFFHKMLRFDTHSYYYNAIINDYNMIVSLLRNNESCKEYFDYFDTVSDQGNWLVYLTSFHKTILYLNYYLKKLLV
jgi:hypothetical protein